MSHFSPRRGSWRLSVLLALAAALAAGCTPDPSTMAAAAAHNGPKEQVAAWKNECGACHLPYPPQLLPARSWRALMGDLDHHFSENASLDPATTRQIEAFLVANAADTRAGGGWFAGNIPPGDTPLRITDTPAWRAIHGDPAPPVAGTGRSNRAEANCLHCHGMLMGDDG